MNCVEAFESCSNCPDHVACLEHLKPIFVCELEICSVHSPGPVEQDELVCFFLIHPIHFDPVRETLHPIAFQELTVRDLSVIRQKGATRADADALADRLGKTGEQNTSPQRREVTLACRAPASEIRSLLIDGARAFAVYDTAITDNIWHASIYARSDLRGSSKQRKRARSAMHNLMAAHVFRIDEIFPH